MTESVPTISLCTTCMNRLHHLRQTLPKNIEVTSGYAGVEFVVLDYNSKDGLDNWLRDEMAPFIRAGRLRVFRTSLPDYFHMSHAKNIAHRQARGRILMNVDADVFVTPELINETDRIFSEDENSITHGRRSAWGRIAIQNKHFHTIGGYNEAMTGWGYEDIDLLKRAGRFLNLRWVGLGGYDQCIVHGDDDRFAHYEIKDHQISKQENLERMNTDLRQRNYVANSDIVWGHSADLAEVPAD